MGLNPQFIETPTPFYCSAVSTTTAVDWVTGGTNGTRIENAVLRNNHSAAVTVEVIYYDGTNSHTFYSKELAAGENLNLLESVFGYNAEKQFIIVANTEKIQIKPTSSVAGAITGYASGGNY